MAKIKKPINSDIASEPAITYAPKAFTWEQLGIYTDLKSDFASLALIKEGIKKPVLNKVIDLMGLSLDELATILHTTDRTLRRYTNATTLNMEQSERLIELAKLYTFGADVFGRLEYFVEWMNEPIMALNHQKPKSYLDTSIGIKLITQLLSRLEHGVYS